MQRQRQAQGKGTKQARQVARETNHPEQARKEVVGGSLLLSLWRSARDEARAEGSRAAAVSHSQTQPKWAGRGSKSRAGAFNSTANCNRTVKMSAIEATG
jgi:hypothetical protein